MHPSGGDRVKHNPLTDKAMKRSSRGGGREGALLELALRFSTGKGKSHNGASLNPKIWRRQAPVDPFARSK